jgi:menaquinone-dependent protoporphyrinogen oxidase
VDVLVGYATAHGATRGVAERIGTRLAAVLGSAVHTGNWLPEGAEYLRRHAAALGRRPVWLFSVSLPGHHSNALKPRVTRWLRPRLKDPAAVSETRTVIRPRDHRAFAGAIRRDHWGLAGDVVFRLIGNGYGDHRDWAEIDAWADGIARRLRPAGDAVST